MSAVAGFLNVLKPPGMTSHDVVAFVRRRTGGKVGHLGTLDPPAAGVLPLALGTATRLLSWLPPARKSYRAEVRFGLETDTLDAAGTVTAERSVGDLAGLREACSRFQGVVLQVPPRVSALKQGGKRGYERARRGEEFDLPAREATYHRVEVVDLAPPLALLDVDCGPGTYVRALARDLGQILGCGAILSFLLRAASGPFRLDEAVTLEEILAAGDVGPLLWSPEETLGRAGVPAIEGDRVVEGSPSLGAPARVLSSGRLVGVGPVVSLDPLQVRVERPL